MGYLLSKFASVRQSILRTAGHEPVRRSPAWLKARSGAFPAESRSGETLGADQIEEAEAAIRLLARLRAPQPRTPLQKLQQNLGTIRQPTRLGLILLTSAALIAAGLVGLTAMNLVSRGSSKAPVLTELPPLPPVTRN